MVLMASTEIVIHPAATISAAVQGSNATSSP